eukprot:366096-Chlamydomonas_euryale.AAC.3
MRAADACGIFRDTLGLPQESLKSARGRTKGAADGPLTQRQATHVSRTSSRSRSGGGNAGGGTGGRRVSPERPEALSTTRAARTPRTERVSGHPASHGCVLGVWLFQCSAVIWWLPLRAQSSTARAGLFQWGKSFGGRMTTAASESMFFGLGSPTCVCMHACMEAAGPHECVVTTCRVHAHMHACAWKSQGGPTHACTHGSHVEALTCMHACMKAAEPEPRSCQHQGRQEPSF